MKADLDCASLLAELKRRYNRAPRYQTIWLACVEARIPAHRAGLRWRFKRADIPTIAGVLGLIDPPTDRAA